MSKDNLVCLVHGHKLQSIVPTRTNPEGGRCYKHPKLKNGSSTWHCITCKKDFCGVCDKPIKWPTKMFWSAELT